MSNVPPPNPPEPSSEAEPKPPEGEVPQANVESVMHVKRWSPVWLVPLVAFIVGVWMVYSHYVGQGPIIEIQFESADGIEANKTKLRAKSVEVGEVLGMRLTDDAKGVILSVRVHAENEDLLHGDSKFWIVRPRVSLLGVTGLNTILSGAYLEMEPGSEDLGGQRLSGLEYVGLDAPPETPFGAPGLHLTLESDSGKHIHAGTPIMFGGMSAGKIEDVEFDAELRRIRYSAFIQEPYDRLITDNTHFWLNSGVAADISADGLRLEFGTLETIAEGGISFGVPEGQPIGNPITADHPPFTLYPYEEAIYKPIYRHSLEYIVLADESVRGLQPGAPVEYRGVKVGEVLRTDIDYDSETILLLEPGSRIPILLKIEPARLGYEDTSEDTAVAAVRIKELIASGLHGEIKTSNYVTGAKVIDLQYLARRPGVQGMFAGYTVIPTTEGQVDQLLVLLENTVEKVNELPLMALAQDTQSTLGKAEEALDQYQQLAADYSAGSEAHLELTQSLKSIDRTLAALVPLIQEIRRKTDRIRLGRKEAPDAEPTGASQ